MADQTLRSLGIALAAGLAGTAAMTLSQAIEQRLTGQRRPRTAASVAENAAGIETETEAGRETLSSGLHWLYGTGLGAALVPLDGVSEPMRSLTFLGGVYGAGLALESLADREEAPARKDYAQFGADFVHHLVYAGAATLAYNGLKAAVSGGEDAGTADSLFSSWEEESRSGSDTASVAATTGGSSVAGVHDSNILTGDGTGGNVRTAAVTGTGGA